MGWTQKGIMELIKLYRLYDCLWNVYSKNYKSLDQKKIAWEHIAEVCGMDVTEVKRKIKALRTAYVAQKKKVDAARKSGDDTHETRLFYFEEMSFLNTVIMTRKVPDSFYEEFQDDSRSSMIFVSTPNDSSAQDSRNPISLNMQSPRNSPRTCPSPTTSVSSNPLEETPQPLHKRKRTEQNENSKLDAAIEAVVKSVTTQEPENVFTSFGKTLALQLQQLPMKEATETMNDIHTLVTRRLLRSLY